MASKFGSLGKFAKKAVLPLCVAGSVAGLGAIGADKIWKPSTIEGCEQQTVVRDFLTSDPFAQVVDTRSQLRLVDGYEQCLKDADVMTDEIQRSIDNTRAMVKAHEELMKDLDVLGNSLDETTESLDDLEEILTKEYLRL